MQKNIKILLIVLGVIAVTIFLIQCIVWYRTDQEATRYQKALVTYLDKKYNQKFTVEKPVHENYGFAVEGHWRATAWPTSNPSMKFAAYATSSGGTDEYPGAFWKQQAYAYVRPTIEAVFGYVPDYSVHVLAYPTQGHPIQGDLPSFINALETYRTQIGLAVTVTSNEQIEASTETLVAQRVHDLGGYLKGAGFTYIGIEYKDPAGGELSYDLGGAPEITPSQPKSIKELMESIKKGR